ncbi:MAG: nucleoside-diphosphate kinase [Deltaproteobacteria bacterium]|nr:nucleoside-diphosphate kinase [Deltaproteobacteria bacterium]MBW2307722.1 nucleoside-diphosphate kinase [Deltaproteobacteria bacterium]
MTQQTLAIIKPDAVGKKCMGEVVRFIEQSDLRITAMKMIRMTKAEAEGFYAVHRGKHFFDSVTTFMSSGPCVVMVLEGAEAIARWREMMGLTDPGKAAPGTIRAKWGSSIEKNVVHGSDAPETALFEVRYFFSEMEIIGGKE